MPGVETERLVLFGAGGHGRDVLDAARVQGRCVVGFVDEDSRLHGVTINGIPVVGSPRWLLQNPQIHVIPAVGNPRVKKKFAAFLDRHRVNLGLPIIHPTAYVSRDAHVGDGSVILAGSAVQPQVQVGRHVYISTVCTLGHDVSVGDFASVHPGVQIGGNVVLGVGSFIGIGATILPKVTIGEWTTVGAGAVVLSDIPAHCTAVGVPARVIKRREPER